jgi:hypothetical protein
MFTLLLLLLHSPTVPAAPQAPILRLRWHMMPPCWTNDPSLLYTPSTGLWHNFYQAPVAANSYPPWTPQGGGTEVWRHATTRDFASWVEEGPVNITLGQGTGSLLALNSSLFLRVFAGHGGMSVGSAADAGASQWVDVPPFPRVLPPATGNPFIGDPFLYYDSAHSEYALLVAACLGGTDFASCKTPVVLKYTASDALHGAFALVGTYFTGPNATGIRPECPRAWAFPGADLLAYSSTLQSRSLWFLGRATRSAFAPAASGQLDAGVLYAAHLSPPAGQGWGGPQALMVGWVREARPQSAAVPWFGTMSAPRALSLAPDALRLSSPPAPCVAQLRRGLLWQGTVSQSTGGVHMLPPSAAGASLWVQAELLAWAPCSEGGGGGGGGGSPLGAAATGGAWGLRVLASPDGSEATHIYLNGTLALVADSTAASLDPTMGRAVYTAAAGASSPGLSSLTLLVDTSLVEAFGNSDIAGEVAASLRSYPTRSDSLGVGVTAVLPQGAAGLCVSVSVWAMP